MRLLFLLVLSLTTCGTFLGAAEPVFSQETRLCRQIFVVPSTWQSFIQWRERFIHPVFCPVVLCHGSCAAFADACVLSEGPVVSRLTDEGGCQGNCH